MYLKIPHNSRTNMKFFFMAPTFRVGHDSSVSIAIRYGLDGLGIEFCWGHTFRPVLGPTQPPIQSVPPLFPGSKTAGVWFRPPTPIQCRG